VWLRAGLLTELTESEDKLTELTESEDKHFLQQTTKTNHNNNIAVNKSKNMTVWIAIYG